MNINGVNTIEDVLCFFISIQKITNGLYDAWYYSLGLAGRPYLYIFQFLNFGKASYTGVKLLQLESQSRCSSLQDLVNGATTIDGMVMLLFKIRQPLIALYAAYIQSQAQRDNGLQYCYIFTNPLAGTTAFGGQNIGGFVKLNNCNFNEYQRRCSCTIYTVQL